MTLSNKELSNWINHLKKESREAIETASDLLKTKHYHFALFLCHLAVEKIIKAFFLSKKKVFAPPVHDLIFFQQYL